jgi:hypothetical protein
LFSELAQTLGQCVVVVLVDGEDGLVRKEVDLGALALGGAHLAQLADGCALGVVLLPGIVVAPDLNVELLGECIDTAYADAVQTTRDLVVGGVELTARMEHGENDLNRRHLLAVDDLVIDGDAAAVVGDGDGIVNVNGDVDARGVATERFVDGVIYYFVDEMVQPLLAGGADIHGRAQAHGRESLENGDVLGRVTATLFFRGNGCVRLKVQKGAICGDCGRCHQNSEGLRLSC